MASTTPALTEKEKAKVEAKGVKERIKQVRKVYKKRHGCNTRF
jgi:hypothetical protein